MGLYKLPKPVKLIVSMFTQDKALFEMAEEKMVKLYGPIDIESEIMDFYQTEYYHKTMGLNLLRKFVSFERLISPDELAMIKRQTNDLEEELGETEQGKALQVDRAVNLDPGYVEPSKLVLASTKNFSHRIYIGNSIYAENTLHYTRGKWRSWPFSYPDYAGGDFHPYLSKVRNRLLEQHKSLS